MSIMKAAKKIDERIKAKVIKQAKEAMKDPEFRRGIKEFIKATT